jgi:biofilm PGA synthesis N-glycosyltransferase PgaC
MPTQGKRFALITPVRDEAKFIGAMIESIMNQSIRPEKWVIVDDGSRDETPEIISQYAAEYRAIDLVRLPERDVRLPGGETAVSQALRRIVLSDYDFLARFDADLAFEQDYMKRILEEFDKDPELGIAGGGLYVYKDGGLQLEKAPEYHVRGALKLYRRQCFEEIGGLTNQIGWDTIDEVLAWSRNWRTRSFFEYRVIHRRPTGDGLIPRRVWWERGKAEYNTWSHPCFVLAKTVKLAAQGLGVIGPACFLSGFLWSQLRGFDRVRNQDFKAVRRRQQWSRGVSALHDRNSSFAVKDSGAQAISIRSPWDS